MADEATTTVAAPAEQPGSQAPARESAPQKDNDSPDLDALIQRAVDRATNKMGNELKKLRAENDTLKKLKLSDDERQELELQERDKALAEREKALAEKENRLFAIKAVKEAGLDDGSDTSLGIVDFVTASAKDEEEIQQRVKTFSALFHAAVQKKVDAVFKAGGRTPGVGADSASNAGGQQESIAVRMGRSSAAVNQKAQETRDYYINGGKKA